jgi:uncharacterized protein (DUF362 family)
MTQAYNDQLARREFLARLLKSGTAIAAAAGISAWFYDGIGPKPGVKDLERIVLPDFSVPRQAGRVISIVTGRQRAVTVGKAIEMLGGIERFVQPGDRVLIKPNAAFASPSRLGATTNPELLEKIIRLCYNPGKARQVIVTDNPINAPASCFSLSGIEKAALRAGALVLMPKKSYFKPVTLAGGKLIKDWPVMVEPLKKVDKLIGIAPVKDHHRSAASMTMKNWYGLLGGRRNIFHQDINTIIAELAQLIKPTLVILDGTEVMVSNGPTGGSLSDLRPMNKMIVSCDQVAADSYGASLLGLSVNDIPYLSKAEQAGVGSTQVESLNPLIDTVTG